MSTVTKISSTNNSQITDYDISKILLGDNSFTEGVVTASGSDVNLTVGQVVGRIGSTQKLVACASAATDGSQFPVGVVIVDQTIADGSSKTVKIVNKGKINEDKLTFDGTDTIDTLIGPADNQKSYRDYLNDLGLVLDSADELTDFDNH